MKILDRMTDELKNTLSDDFKFTAKIMKQIN